MQELLISEGEVCRALPLTDFVAGQGKLSAAEWPMGLSLEDEMGSTLVLRPDVLVHRRELRDGSVFCASIPDSDYVSRRLRYVLNQAGTQQGRELRYHPGRLQ